MCLLKISHWLPLSLRTKARVLLMTCKVPLIWHAASSGTQPLIMLTPQCPLHTTCVGFMLILKHANMSHSICSGLKHSSSGYLPDFLPQNSDISSEITPHSVLTQSTTVFAWISPKAEPETKVWMHMVLGGNWSQGKESRRERKLNQGYLSDLIELSLASSLCGSWRMCSRIIYSDEEEASMYLPLPSPSSQRLLKGILLPLTKWVHAFTRIHACGLSCFSPVWFFETTWAVAHQAPLSLRFSRQEYWSGLSCSPLKDLPNPGIKLMSLTSPALAGGSLPLIPPGKPIY